jgi:hypothetical protein
LDDLEEDVKDFGQKRGQFITAFVFGSIDCGSFLHVGYCVANVLVGNRVFFNVIQKMSKDRMEQLNWRCDGYLGRSRSVAAIVN